MSCSATNVGLPLRLFLSVSGEEGLGSYFGPPKRDPAGAPPSYFFSWFCPLVFILFDQYRWCDHLSFLFTSILLSFICNSVTRTNSFHLFFIPRSFRTSPAFLSHDLFFLLHSFASFLFFHLHNIYRIVYS